MPTKTTFLNLNKIQENEYYNTDIENQNLDKIDESIKGYDLRTSTIENIVNKRDQLQIKLSSNQQIQSVKDSFGGSCDFEIEGMLVDQLIENGDFEDDIRGWSLGKDYLGNISVHATVVWENGKLKITGNPDATATYIVPWNRPFKVVLNQKYFLYTQMKSDNSECTGFDIGLYKDGGNLIGDKIVSTESPPLANKWYEVYGVVTASQHTDTDCFCLPVARYSTAGQPIANKSIYYEKVMCIPLQTEDQNLTANQLKEKYVDNGYFEGLKPLQGVCLEGTGKNYMPVQSFTLENKIYNTLVQGYLNLKSNTHYTLCAKVRNGSARITVSNGISLHAVNETSIGNKLTFNTGDNGKWSYWFTNDSDGDTPTIYDIMLVEGTEAPKFYIPHISSKVSFKDALAMLPNGVNDKIIRLNEKTTKHVYTNVGRDGIPYKLKKTDILDMDTSSPLVDRIVVSDHKFEDYLQGNAINNNAVMSKFKQVSSNEWSGSKNDINTFYFTPTKGIRITVAKNKYANIEEAKEDLQDTPLVYELEKPQYIDLSSKTAFLNSHHNYTAFSVLDGVIKDEHIPVKYNGITGFWTNDVNPNSPLTYSPWHYKVKYIIDLVELLPDGSKRSVLNFFTMNLNSTHSYGYLRGYFPADIVKKHGIDINNIYASYKTSETNNQGNVKIKYNADMPNTISSNTNAINAVGRQIDKLATKTHQTIEEYDKRTSSIEGKINKKDLLKLELSSSKKVNSIKDSCGGACDFEIEGALVENIMKNGDVVNTIVSDGTGSPIQIDSNGNWVLKSLYNPSHQTLNLVCGHKYFLYAIASSNNLSNTWTVRYSDNTFDQKIGSGRSSEVGFIITATKTQRGHIMPSEGDLGDLTKKYQMIIPMTELGIDSYTKEQMLAICRSGYFEGLQPLRGVAIEAVGKNLFDVNSPKSTSNVNEVVLSQGSIRAFANRTYIVGNQHYITLKPNTNYTMSFNVAKIGNATDYQCLIYDLNDVSISFKTSPVTKGRVNFTFVTSKTSRYKIEFARYGGINDANGGVEYLDIQLEEGSVATAYTPHTSSQIVLDAPLAKLPNGVADKIVRKDGKTIKYVNTNVGRDAQFLKLDTSTASFTTSESNMNFLRFENYTKGKGVKKIDKTNISGDCHIEGRREANAVSSEWDEQSLTNIFATYNDNLWITFPKTVDTKDKAIELIKDAKITYQLASSQTIELSDKLEALNSFEDYTQFQVSDGIIENEKTIASFYKTTGNYLINGSRVTTDNPLDHKVKKIIDVQFDGRSISDLGSVIIDDAGINSVGWLISRTKVEENNIDPSQLYISYTTTETNGQANAKVKYNADMSSAISSNTSTINLVGEQVDIITKKMNEVLKYQPTPLGNSIVNTGDPHEVRVVNGYLEGFGALTVTDVISGTVILNTGTFKPKEGRTFRVGSNLIDTIVDIQVKNNGDWVLAFSGIPPTYIYLDQVRFKIGD